MRYREDFRRHSLNAARRILARGAPAAWLLLAVLVTTTVLVGTTARPDPTLADDPANPAARLQVISTSAGIPFAEDDDALMASARCADAS